VSFPSVFDRYTPRGYHADVPIYDYRCEACGASFEQLRPFTAADMATCPSCGADDARRLLSRVASYGRADCGPSSFG